MSTFKISTLALAFLLAFTAGAQTNTTTQSKTDPLHEWVQGNDPAALEAWVNQRLEEEKADLEKLLAVKGPRTVENTLRPFDDAENQLSLAGNNAFLLYSLADAAALRDKGQAMSAKISTANTELSLNQEVYKALAAIPLPTDDPATRHYLERTLLEYRLAGVDKDEATRAKIRGLQDKVTDLSLKFGRNVADGTLKITATKAELDGLPADYIARHKPAADGTYTLTTEQPDVMPVMSFAKSPDLRRKMFLAYTTRAYPQNTQVLRDLLATRQELATTLGYAHYANLATADQMIGSPAKLEAVDPIKSTRFRALPRPKSMRCCLLSRKNSNRGFRASASLTRDIGENSTGAPHSRLTRRACVPTSLMTRCRRGFCKRRRVCST